LRAGGQQHPDGFPVSAAVWLAEADTGERLPGRPHGVDLVALHPATTRRPLRAVDLNDPLAASVQCRGQSGTEAPGAFDGPQPRVVAPPEGDQLAVASRIGGHRQMFKDSARRTDRRRGVGVVMGVDADHDVKISMEGQHAVRSLAEGTSIPARATLRQDCDEPHPEADKLLIKPTRQPGPVPAATTDKSH